LSVACPNLDARTRRLRTIEEKRVEISVLIDNAIR